MAGVDIDPNQISAARKAGYSDDEIAGFLSDKHPEQFKQAKDAGYSSSEILNHFAPEPDVSKDVATQVGYHAAQLPENLLSSAPQLFNALGHGVTALADKFAPSSGTVRNYVEGMKKQQAEDDARAAALQPNLPTVANITPEAQTAPGRVAGNMTDFAGMGLLPGTIPQRIAHVLKPAIGSEVGGAIGGYIDPKYEGAGRIAGAVLSGNASREPAPVKSGAYFDQADKNFQALRDAKVDLHQDSVRGFAQKTQAALESGKDLEGTEAYKLLNKYATVNGSVPLSKLEVLRSNLSDAAQSPVGREREAGRFARDQLEQYRDSLTPAHTVANGQGLADALANWRAGDKNQLIGNTVKSAEGQLYRADLNNASAHTGDNVNALRQALKPLLLQSKYAKRFTGDDKETLENIVHGSAGLNVARRGLSLINGHNNFLLPLIGGETIGQASGSPLEGAGAAAAIHMGLRGAGAVLSRMQRSRQRQDVNALLNTIGARSVGVAQPRPAVSPLVSRALAGALAARQ